MKIIILGSNKVSQTLAENLANENNDITLIDTNADRLRELQNRYDIQTIIGHGSYPDILSLAQANDTEMLLAVSENDEVNMLACQVAYSLFHIPIKIARIRAENYLTNKALYSNDQLPVDVIISPEQLVMEYVKSLIEYPGALQVLDFANGKVRLVAIKASKGGPLAGKSLSELKEQLVKLNANVASIFRGNQSVPLNDGTVIKIGDEVFFIADSHKIVPLMKLLGRMDHPNKRIMIAGGGNIGKRLARSLEDAYQVKVIERNPSIAHRISLELDEAVVLQGDASDKDLLTSESIENFDVFCALTNDDEANIMSCLQAKRLGATYAMALVAKSAYIDLIEGENIDILISPQNTTISSILAYIRQGDIVNVHTLRREAAEAIEIVAHGDHETSKVVGKAINDIYFPEDVTVGAIVRKGKMIVPEPNTVIESEDHVILFLANKARAKDVERLFQVKVTFF